MAITEKMILILKDPVVFPGYGSDPNVTIIYCKPFLDRESPLSGLAIGIDVGVDAGGARFCIPKENIAAYVYETTDGSLDAIKSASLDSTPGFYDAIG